MKKLKPRQQVYVALLVLILIGYVGLIVLWLHQRGEIRSLDSEMKTLIANQAASNGSTYNDVTISPTERVVYLPLANVKLPATNLTEDFVYTYMPSHTISGDKKVFPATLSISTHDLAANSASTTQQFDCTEVAYADFVTKSYPVNPMYKSDGSIRLADGRTMNIYYAPSIPGCHGSWKINNINSKVIADTLKEAVSY